MSFFLSFFQREKPTASVAKERLQLILAHERSGRNAGQVDFLPQMQAELLKVISKYIKINDDDVTIQVDRRENLDILEVKIEMPETR
jgi:cell division topological specificity factor